MALSSLRLRRALALSSYLTKHHTPSSPFPSISCPPPLSFAIIASQNPSLGFIHPHLPFQSRLFRSSSSMLSSSRYRQNNNDEEIGPDTILFEGCDYNHWLITMDFPKDPAPTREEMIETYLQTLAKVVGSYDEAKKKMYAFSTTTYQGFQCLVTEEMSEKFRGLPGVVFILPDSYIDPVNKQYGGDKYDNGIITPRPPPLQYGRQGRYNDRNREFSQNRPRQPMRNQQHNPSYGNQRPPMYGDARNFDQQQNSPMQPNYGPSGTGDGRDNQQLNPPFGNQRPPMYGDARNFDQQQNSPMQPNYGPAGAGDSKDPMTMNNAPRGTDPMPMQPNYGSAGAGASRDSMPMNNAPRGTAPMPSYQPTYNQNQQGYYNPQGGRVLPEQRDYQRDIRGDNRNYTPPQGPTYGQGSVGHYSPMADANYGQGAGGNYGPDGRGNYNRQGAGANYGQGAGANYGQGAGGNYGQGAGGNYGQGAWGSHGQGGGAVQRQEMGAGSGQSQPGNGEEHMFSQVEQRNNMQGEHTTYAPMAQTGQTK